MNKQLLSLVCLTLLATTLPSCRNRKKEAIAQQEEINTLIELENMIEEKIEERIEELDAKIIKF